MIANDNDNKDHSVEAVRDDEEEDRTSFQHEHHPKEYEGKIRRKCDDPKHKLETPTLTTVWQI